MLGAGKDLADASTGLAITAFKGVLMVGGFIAAFGAIIALLVLNPRPRG